MKYRLLAFDLDGTALGSDPDAFGPDFARAAEKAAARGCILAAATGRPGGCLPAEMVPPPPWLSWLILCDGAEIRRASTGERIWSRPFSAESLRRVESAAGEWGLWAEYIDRESRYHLPAFSRCMLEKAKVSEFHRQIIARRGCPLESPAETLAGREILKINLLLAPEPLREPFRRAVGDAALVMDCGPGGMELAAPGAGKKAAVEYLAGRLGFGMEQVMALGDSGNDAPLLAAAGLGVAMGNAPAWVRTAARAVTVSNIEGGAARAIRRWLLEE